MADQMTAAATERGKSFQFGFSWRLVLAVAITSIGALLILLTLLFSGGGKHRAPVAGRQVRSAGVRLYEQQKFSLAADKLARFVADHPDDPAAKQMLADSYWLAGKPKLALVEYLKLLRQRPGDGAALYRTGLLYGQLGADGLAVTYLKRAAATRNDQPLYHAELAKAYGRRQDYRQAVLHWQRVLDLTPEPNAARATVEAEIGDVLLAAGDRAGARLAYEEGLRLDPGNEYLKTQVTRTGP